MLCPQCRADNRDDAAFCLQCGGRLALACASCGRELPASARFCDVCGTAVAGATPAGATTPAAHTPYRPPAHLAERILRDRSAIEGERRTVTVLFIDAVSSTAKSERLDPEVLHRTVQACTEKMIDAVNRFEGTVTQFRGDGIMAIFGAPIAHEDSARRAVAAALAMREMLQQYEQELIDAGAVGFNYRIGINTGPVVVGVIGNDLTMDYTAVGDTVNLAARMEQSASPGSIYITAATHRAVDPYFELRDLGLLEVKGKAEGVRAYEVIRELPARTRLHASIDRGLTPYVGRDESISVLRQHFERAQQGAGQVVFISGDAGMGKSRLLFEFRRSLGDSAGWFEGRCLSWGASFPYLPIMDIVKSAFGIDEMDDDATAIERIDGGTARWDAAARDAVPHLKDLINLAPGHPGITAMDPAQRNARMLDALRALVTQESRQRPLVIVVEDLHWADEQSEAALASLVDAVASAPVLVLMTYRPGYVHTLGDRTYYGRVTLTTLAADASASIVSGALQSSGVPQRLQEMIVAKAEGNPFFIEEVSRSLVETGVLRRTNGVLTLARPVDDVRIPDTIQEVILSRLDRLQGHAKEAVQYASVIGREFPVRLLKHVAQAEHDVDALLGELKMLELIYEKTYFPELEYVFKHALTQEVALSTLLADRRKELHRIVATAIEELYADRLSEQHEALAYHYFQGEEWEKACDFAKLVAERADRLYAPRAVIAHVTHAIEAAERCGDCEDHAVGPKFYALRGRAYENVGDFERAEADYERSRDIAAGAGDVAAEWQAHADLGMLWAGRDYARTGEHFERAHELAQRSGDRVLIARSLNRLGNWRMNVEHPVEGLQYHAEALRIFEELGDKRGIAETLDFHCMASALSGDLLTSYESGIKACRLFDELADKQALAAIVATVMFTGPTFETQTMVTKGYDPAVLARYGDPVESMQQIAWRSGEAYALMQRAMHHAGRGDYGSALRDARRGHQIAQEIGHVQWEVGTGVNLALIHSHLFDRQTIELGERMLSLAVKIGSLHWRRCSTAHLAMAFTEFGELDNAENLLAAELDPGLPMITVGQRMMWMARAELLLARKQYAEAMRVVELLGATAANAGNAGVHAVPYLALKRGEAMVGLGRLDSAAADLDAALKGFEGLNMLPVHWRALAARARLFEAQSREDDARRAYADALQIIDRMGASINEPNLKASLLGSALVADLRARSGIAAL